MNGMLHLLVVLFLLLFNPKRSMGGNEKMKIEPITYKYDNGPDGHGFVVIDLVDGEEHYLFHGQTKQECEEFIKEDSKTLYPH